VITASLYSRFRSRGNGDFADRVLAALRNQFGGHAVKAAPKGTAPANGATPAKATKAKRGRSKGAKAAGGR
jgi:6-phosphogluconate dehydrogenase